MTKGQSVILEFILFFAIVFSLFSTISFFFYNQNNYFQQEIAESTSQLINDLVSSNILKGIECKSCSSLIIDEKIPSKIGGQYYKVKLDTNYGINTTLLSSKVYSKQSSVLNLNETFSLSGESSSENKRIEIQINNINNQVEVE